MRRLHLVALADVVAALEQVPIAATIDGVAFVQASDLLAALSGLGVDLDTATVESATFDASVFSIPRSEPQPEIETGSDLDAERARLAALPPGPCICASRFATYPNDPRHNPQRHVHPAGPCEACASSSVPCTDYVDTIVRDPIQARLERGEPGPAPEEIPAFAQPEPTFDPGARPALRSAPQPYQVGGPTSTPEYDPTPQGPVIGE